jgi:hypothetical protein
LLPRNAGRLELIGRTLQDIETGQLDTAGAQSLLVAALENAKRHGLAFRDQVLRLSADSRLQELVRRSRHAAATGDAAAEE